jgi:DNA-directed RNA polymerase subunit RPC12/RpoP
MQKLPNPIAGRCYMGELIEQNECLRCGSRFDAKEGDVRCVRCSFIVARRWQAVRAVLAVIVFGGLMVWWLTR